MSTVRRGLLLFVLVTSTMACLLCILSMATNNWLTASAVLTDRLQNHINYGLFTGHLQRQQLAAKLPFQLAIVCDFGNGGCMFSCQQNTALRKDELARIIAGAPLMPCEQDRSTLTKGIASTALKQVTAEAAVDADADADLALVPGTWWLCTVLSLATMLLFEICGVGFVLLNLFTNPVERIFNIFGLYVWNAAAAACALLTLTLWMTLFLQHLQRNVAITDTLRNELTFTSTGRANVSYSLYILAIAPFFNILNIGILLLRRRLLTPPTANTTAMAEQTDTPLQFY